MPATPNITLTATLLDYSGNTIGTSAQPAWLRIALCGFGGVLPAIAGTGNITKITSWFVDIPFTGTALSVKLWGNDQISPSGTYYAISLLDTQKNVLQTGIYQFTGTQTIDLSNAPQIVQPPVPQIFNLVTLATAGSVPGSVFTVPTPIWGNTLQAVFYKGVFYPRVKGATTNWALIGQTLTMNFACTEVPFAQYIEALA
jgi:hypothetical protein